MTDPRSAKVGDLAGWFIAIYVGVPIACAVALGLALLTKSNLPLRVFLVVFGLSIVGRVVLRWRTGLFATPAVLKILTIGLQGAAALACVVFAFSLRG
jgi:hypothetical protein